VSFPGPLPAGFSRIASPVIVVAWIAQMVFLAHRTYFQDPSVSLRADLGHYGTAAQWKGVYYRGSKIGFTVSQIVPIDGGYELQEDGQLQMLLMGATSAVRIRTAARVDASFALKSFTFSLDPGTGPVEVEGTVEGKRLHLGISSASGRRTETRDLPEPPALSLNLPRRLLAEGLAPGRKVDLSIFDPATLRNAPMRLEVKAREVVWVSGRPVPAFRVENQFSGITATSWVTDVGEIVKEESSMGFISIREPRSVALALAVPGDVQTDMLKAAAVVPTRYHRIDDPGSVELLRARIEGGNLEGAELQGAGQQVSNGVFEIERLPEPKPEPADPESSHYLLAEPFIESDAPEILAEATVAVKGAVDPRSRAERLVRHVHAILEKKPTVSLPSALEVLRTRVGDCNEHTALYVAMARSLGLPSRVAVGLVYLYGAFYYHAWAEVYLAEEPGRGLWVPVDPTLNQFPADATHIRLARGGLDRQTVILPLLGRLKITILEVRLRKDSQPVLVGRARQDVRPIEVSIPHRTGPRGCWARPEP